MATTCLPWVPDPACLPESWGIDPAAWDPQQAAAVEVAYDVLVALTGYRFLLCQLTLRPCRRPCGDLPPTGPGLWFNPRWPPYGSGAAWLGPWPTLRAGQWFNTCTCGRGRDCSCGPMCEIDLPGPVHVVVQVKVDGAVLPAAAYRVDQRRWLVRLDGGCFPWCQQLDRPDTEPNTMSVTYLRGRPAGLAGRRALAVYAVELWKACVGDKTCRLPRRTVAVARQGVDMQFADPMDLLKAGLTGLTDVDAWITAVNPDRLRRDSIVWSPDLRRGRTVTS